MSASTKRPTPRELRAMAYRIVDELETLTLMFMRGGCSLVEAKARAIIFMADRARS